MKFSRKVRRRICGDLNSFTPTDFCWLDFLLKARWIQSSIISFYLRRVRTSIAYSQARSCSGSYKMSGYRGSDSRLPIQSIIFLCLWTSPETATTPRAVDQHGEHNTRPSKMCIPSLPNQIILGTRLLKDFSYPRAVLEWLLNISKSLHQM